jgi:hypothetical protein
MIRILAIITKAGSEVVEYVVIDDRRYATTEDFLAAARHETGRLSFRHGLPNNDLELFDGSDRSEESFFRMFPSLKVTPSTARSEAPSS